MAEPSGAEPAPGESYDAVARLYVGNILYAIETAALSLGEQGRREDAAFYRGLARKLAEAFGRESRGG